MFYYNRAFLELLKKDRRYCSEAYAFVFETLEYAQNILKLGKDEVNEPFPDELLVENEELQALQKLERQDDTGPRHHITGRDLCYAAKEYAISQYGRLARSVLESIGIKKTDDIGEIVYNLISIGQMRKTSNDRKEDFDDVFDFEAAFDEGYRI